MSARSDLIDNFLKEAGWPSPKRSDLAGDASFRRYERVFCGGRRGVVMDAPPDKEDVRPFIRVCNLLHDFGLSAPEILASDITHGLLLLEDLGDDLYSRLLKNQPAKEEEIYLAAADVLIELYQKALLTKKANISIYNQKVLLRESRLFSEWFIPAVAGDQAPELHASYVLLWQELLTKLPQLPEVLVMRDYHADNLLWLPDRKGVKRVGLLDFQDAVLGSPAYDLVSILEDARRDVSATTVKSLLECFLERTQLPSEDFMAAYAFLGAQRNCKIIGIFLRLAVRDGKRQYLSYLPRVWRHLEGNLQHPLLKPLKIWMETFIKPEWRGIVSIPQPSVLAIG